MPQTVTPHTTIESGSFRDRNGRIFYSSGAVYRGISLRALEEWKALSSTKFFQPAVDAGKLISTVQVSEADIPERELGGEWAAFLKHEMIPFVSYPYEW